MVQETKTSEPLLTNMNLINHSFKKLILFLIFNVEIVIEKFFIHLKINVNMILNLQRSQIMK